MKRWWSTAAVAAFGVLVGHGVAYAGPGAASHPPVVPFSDAALVVTAPFAALGLFLLAAGEARRARRLRPERLLGAQLALFLVQESVERAAADMPLGGLLSDRALWAGLAAQLGLVALATLTVRAAARTLRPGPRSARPTAAPRVVGAATVPLLDAPPGGAADRPAARGPPLPGTCAPVPRPRSVIHVPSPS